MNTSGGLTVPWGSRPPPSANLLDSSMMTLQILLGVYCVIAVLLYLTMCTAMSPQDGNFIIRQLKAFGISALWLPWLVFALAGAGSF